MGDFIDFAVNEARLQVGEIIEIDQPARNGHCI